MNTVVAANAIVAGVCEPVTMSEHTPNTDLAVEEDVLADGGQQSPA